MKKQSTVFVRRLIIVASTIALVATVYALSHAFTWEGELDPNEFGTWKPISRELVTLGLFQVMVQNPDPTSPIKRAVLYISCNDDLLGYQYFKQGKPYRFWFDKEQEKYARTPISEKEKQGCMKCHQGQGPPGNGSPPESEKEDALIRL